MKKIVYLVMLISQCCAAPQIPGNPNCHPQYSKNNLNYILGYGSLLNKMNRNKTSPDISTTVIPVKVKGFNRSWNLPSNHYKTIFLGISPCEDKTQCEMNSVAYLSDDLASFDKRESGYCRVIVPSKNVKSYSQDSSLSDENSRFWIYLNKAGKRAKPSAKTPIVQSYVDTFLGGCIEQDTTISHKPVKDMEYPRDFNFLFDCITSTAGWDTNFWFNDRIFPQRPWVMSPYSLTIDKAISSAQQSGTIKGKINYYDIPIQR